MHIYRYKNKQMYINRYSIDSSSDIRRNHDILVVDMIIILEFMLKVVKVISPPNSEGQPPPHPLDGPWIPA